MYLPDDVDQWVEAQSESRRESREAVLKELVVGVARAMMAEDPAVAVDDLVAEWGACPACGGSGSLPECGACEGCLLSGEGGRFGGRRPGCGGRCGCSDER